MRFFPWDVLSQCVFLKKGQKDRNRMQGSEKAVIRLKGFKLFSQQFIFVFVRDLFLRIPPNRAESSYPSYCSY